MRNFHSHYSAGFVRLAACVPRTRVGNPAVGDGSVGQHARQRDPDGRSCLLRREARGAVRIAERILSGFGDAKVNSIVLRLATSVGPANPQEAS
jgi:hypothetical protein